MKTTKAPQAPREQWEMIELTPRRYAGRYFCQKVNGLHLNVGDDGHQPQPRYWFVVYREGESIARGNGYRCIQEAQVAAEAV